MTPEGSPASDRRGDGTSVGAVTAMARRHLVRLGRVLWGDRSGLAVFLAAVVFLGALWRIDFLLTDSETVANLLTNVADGRLAIVDTPYSLTAGQQPGLVDVDGRLYGRNYGQVYLAVPLLWLLDGLAGLVDLRLLLSAGWALAIVTLCETVASHLDRPRIADIGAGLGLCAFVLSALVATQIGWFDRPRPLVALGLSTVLLAAVGATTLYRLLAWAHGRRLGIAGGLALVVASPVGFWASFPKRHVLSATALLLTCFLFAVSREGAGRRQTLARAGAYAVVGYLASVHAFEGAFALAILAPLDLATAPSNDRRTLAVVAVVAFLAVTPMLATNAAVSGDPFSPPRTLPGAEGGLPTDPGGGGGEDGGAGGSDGADGGATGSGGGTGPSLLDGLPFVGLLAPLFAVLDKIGWVAGYMYAAVVEGLAASTELDRLGSVFVRGGWIPGVDYHHNGYEAYELTVLEALPLAGALAWLPVAAVRGLRDGLGPAASRLRAGLADPVRQTDLLAGGFALTLVTVYLPLLPLFSTITVRYVVPALALVLYVVFRLAPVRAGVREAGRSLAVAYGATVLFGGLGVIAALWALDPATGEAVQLHALVGIAAAAIVGATTATWPLHRRPRLVAASLGLAAGATTVFLGLAALSYFADGNHALDLVRIAADVVGHVG